MSLHITILGMVGIYKINSKIAGQHSEQQIPNHVVDSNCTERYNYVNSVKL